MSLDVGLENVYLDGKFAEKTFLTWLQKVVDMPKPEQSTDSRMLVGIQHLKQATQNVLDKKIQVPSDVFFALKQAINRRELLGVQKQHEEMSQHGKLSLSTVNHQHYLHVLCEIRDSLFRVTALEKRAPAPRTQQKLRPESTNIFAALLGKMSDINSSKSSESSQSPTSDKSTQEHPEEEAKEESPPLHEPPEASQTLETSETSEAPKTPKPLFTPRELRTFEYIAYIYEVLSDKWYESTKPNGAGVFDATIYTRIALNGICDAFSRVRPHLRSYDEMRAIYLQARFDDDMSRDVEHALWFFLRANSMFESLKSYREVFHQQQRVPQLQDFEEKIMDPWLLASFNKVSWLFAAAEEDVSGILDHYLPFGKQIRNFMLPENASEKIEASFVLVLDVMAMIDRSIPDWLHTHHVSEWRARLATRPGPERQTPQDIFEGSRVNVEKSNGRTIPRLGQIYPKIQEMLGFDPEDNTHPLHDWAQQLKTAENLFKDFLSKRNNMALPWLWELDTGLVMRGVVWDLGLKLFEFRDYGPFLIHLLNAMEHTEVTGELRGPFILWGCSCVCLKPHIFKDVRPKTFADKYTLTTSTRSQADRGHVRLFEQVVPRRIADRHLALNHLWHNRYTITPRFFAFASANHVYHVLATRPGGSRRMIEVEDDKLDIAFHEVGGSHLKASSVTYDKLSSLERLTIAEPTLKLHWTDDTLKQTSQIDWLFVVFVMYKTLNELGAHFQKYPLEERDATKTKRKYKKSAKAQQKAQHVSKWDEAVKTGLILLEHMPMNGETASLAIKEAADIYTQVVYEWFSRDLEDMFMFQPWKLECPDSE